MTQDASAGNDLFTELRLNQVSQERLLCWYTSKGKVAGAKRILLSPLAVK